MNVFIEYDKMAGPVLRVENGAHIRIIPVAAVASWGELLGIDDLEQVLDAIIHVQDYGEPEPDPVTSENVWTDSYTLLSHREQAREQEALKAQEEGTRDDPRSPLLRATLAAYNAVHQPVDGGECVMDRCRRAARERLGIDWEPSAKTKASSRLMTRTLSATTAQDSEQKEYADVLEPLRGQVEHNRREFLHQLTGNSVNPLRDTTPLEAEHGPEENDPFAATLRKYGAK